MTRPHPLPLSQRERGDCGDSRSVTRRHEPDVAELHGVMVALEDNRALGYLAFILLVLNARRALELLVLLDQSAVQVNRGAGLLGDLAVGVEARARKKMSIVCHSPAGFEAFTLGGVWL